MRDYCKLKINLTVSINGAGTSTISTIIKTAIAKNGTARNPKRFLRKAINRQIAVNNRKMYKMAHDLLNLLKRIVLC